MHSRVVPGWSQRLKWWWTDLRAARVSLSLVALFALVEAALSVRGGAEAPAVTAVYQTLGLSGEGIWSGRLWQVGTHAFLHGGWLHLGLNSLLLIATGARVERIADGRTAARVFGAGVLGGAAAFLLLPASDAVLVGASGGIFALLLWLTTVSPGSRMAPLPLSARSVGLGILLTSGALALAAPWWAPEGAMFISHACHFGGALAGWVMARRLLRLPRLPERRD